MAEPAFTESKWESGDGLGLRYRDYTGPDTKPPLLCLHGLTRNARDFEPLAERFAGEWRLIVPDMRGRGQSEYAREAASYRARSYIDDVVRLLGQLDCGPVVAVGTSMGGMIAMLMAQARAWPLAGAVLNDIGPDLEAAGIERIRGYVGQGGNFETWMHAARHLREQAHAAHPDFAIGDWLAYAKRVMVMTGNGRIAFDYDMKIAEEFNAPSDGEPFDLWGALRALAGIPTLALRGELSDLLSAATVAKMQAELPGLKAVTVPRVGHPPTLAEPQAQQAIADLLAEVA
uniref:alpha/beta fold hydrolase n=1 Tax=Altererythrobacter segetis TaxID=1104773 RepID=UPI00140A5BA6|nr:alpha/beta hydrolase [Altererythrobacter segetis]